ncbi:Alpha/Beta hydrolase protein [Dactylonectria estremocensis]|uniref:Alpha/Beta hydrolase protein n=1 Tax=Dactylonectria estremocensis TaxID=1079267 RepID=A0A9P9IP56_9HYPO|nr:Alpha/Beta hydrolase protein [Dactylonectria estremocensis]
MDGSNINIFSLADFNFEDGTTLPNIQLAYLDLNSSASKLAVIQTCFRGRLTSTLNFAKGALRDYRIIILALLSNGESSSPSNKPGFPTSIYYQDCVRAQHELLNHLSIGKVDVMIGFSMGGQCTYYWTVMHPDFVQNAVIICSSAHTSRHNYQFLEGPKTALENSIDYADRSQSPALPKSPRGLRAFGKAYSAWLTSAEWFDQGLYKDLGYETLQDWDKDVAGANYDSWDPDDLLTKLRMWQNGNIAACDPSSGDSLEETLSHIKARVLLMPCRTDQYFCWEASERECKLIPDAQLKVIPSVWGHLAGAGSNQKDSDWMDHEISEFLRSTHQETAISHSENKSLNASKLN